MLYQEAEALPDSDLTPPHETYGDYGHALARAGISTIPLIGGLPQNCSIF
jgi:hypothetical protein